MAERLECEILQKQPYLNPLTNLPAQAQCILSKVLQLAYCLQ